MHETGAANGHAGALPGPVNRANGSVKIIYTGRTIYMKRNYIGLATSLHDPSIAIVNSKGEVVFAEATERYVQNKRAPLISPDQFIHYIAPSIKNLC